MKKLFNFYLEEDIKTSCCNKLERLFGKQEKGALSALIRVLLNKFLLTKDDDLKDIMECVSDEYEYSQLKNKRSRL